MVMSIDESIRRVGFRRWYERQLIEGHLWLVTGFLSLIMMAVALEVIPFRESFAGSLTLLVVGASGALLCVVAWRKFTQLLFRAEHFAGQAVCAQCREYAKFTIVAANYAADAVDGRAMNVRCRKCAHEWTIG
jgi:hypothetical protein